MVSLISTPTYVASAGRRWSSSLSGEAANPTAELEHRPDSREGGIGDQRPVLVERLEVLATTKPIVEARGLVAGQGQGMITTSRLPDQARGPLERTGP